MIKILITIGLPGSGKSTWAKSVIDKHPNTYKRVNKDELRAMIDNNHFSKDTEKFILKLRDLIIINAVLDKKHVMVDDTNLAPKHIKHIEGLAKEIGAKVILKDFTHIPLETCIKQDLKRFNSVGETVIRKMYNQYLAPKIEEVPFYRNKPRAIISDLDGTLFHMNDRSPYDASTCENDTIDIVVRDILNLNAERGMQIILVSGRDNKYRTQTEKALQKHDIIFNKLYMRGEGDMRKDTIVKKEIYDTHILGNYNIDFVLDDRPTVCRFWREIGLKVLQVGDPHVEF